MHTVMSKAPWFLSVFSFFWFFVIWHSLETVVQRKIKNGIRFHWFVFRGDNCPSVLALCPECQHPEAFFCLKQSLRETLLRWIIIFWGVFAIVFYCFYLFSLMFEEGNEAGELRGHLADSRYFPFLFLAATRLRTLVFWVALFEVIAIAKVFF